MSPRAGQTISHYRIIKKLGVGGMGVVYHAEDTRLKRPVALKFLSHELTRAEDTRKRFIREAQAASRLDHPNICSVHEIEETHDGRLFICMAYYEGETLRDRLQRGSVALGEALDIVCQVAAGLEGAHGNGIVHRDLSPANVMVTKDGAVKVLDFGLAKLKDQSKLTRSGRTVGTIAYMSPEQARGEDVDARTDIFSLGAVLYELLADRAPFDGDHETAILYKILNVDPERLSQSRPDLPEGLERIVDKALQKDVSTRYQTVAEMREDLLRVTEGLKPIRAKLPRRYLRVVLPLAAIAAALAIVMATPGLRNGLKKFLGAEPPPMHIVVLPFENVGGNPDDQAFCDGLTETVTTQLTQFGQFRQALWVVPASEVRNRTISPSQARDQLGVNMAVTGSVQRVDDRFRITLSLINLVKKDRPRQVSATTIDNLVADVSPIQDETMVRLARMLDVELLPQNKRVLAAGGTAMPGAYYTYVQGLGYLRRYEKRENIERAIVLFESAIAQDSLYARAYAGLGEAYWRLYNDSRDPRWIEPAKRSCERAIAIDRFLSPAHVTLGMIYTREAPERAVSEFERALAVEPGSAEAYRGLAGTYAVLGMPAKAESTYRRAIDMKPDYWGGYAALARFYWDNQQYEEALVSFQKVVQLSPDNYLGYNGLGACYIRLGSYREAAAMLERSIRLEPKQAHRHYLNLAALYYGEGRYTQSAKMAEKAIEAGGSTNYKAWTNLANACYWLPNKREEAYEAYRCAASLVEGERKAGPCDADILATLAGYYAILGESSRASVLIEEALQLEPNNARVNYLAGHACEQLGRRDEALDLIGKAVFGGYVTAEEIARDPFLRALRTDARFSRVLDAGRSSGKQ